MVQQRMAPEIYTAAAPSQRSPVFFIVMSSNRGIVGMGFPHPTPSIVPRGGQGFVKHSLR